MISDHSLMGFLVASFGGFPIRTKTIHVQQLDVIVDNCVQGLIWEFVYPQKQLVILNLGPIDVEFPLQFPLVQPIFCHPTNFVPMHILVFDEVV